MGSIPYCKLLYILASGSNLYCKFRYILVSGSISHCELRYARACELILHVLGGAFAHFFALVPRFVRRGCLFIECVLILRIPKCSGLDFDRLRGASGQVLEFSKREISEIFRAYGRRTCKCADFRETVARVTAPFWQWLRRSWTSWESDWLYARVDMYLWLHLLCRGWFVNEHQIEVTTGMSSKRISLQMRSFSFFGIRVDLHYISKDLGSYIVSLVCLIAIRYETHLVFMACVRVPGNF